MTMAKNAEILAASILIVDDQEAGARLLERMLRGAGYQSISVTQDPLAVRALYLQQRYDLILLDLQMPVMDGFQVMDSLREVELEGYLPVLVVTAQPGHRLRALQAGAKDFISKPFELAEVLARVHNMLEVRLLHRSLHRSNEVLEQRVLQRTAELQGSYLETIVTMLRAAEYKDEDTGAHVVRISHYSRLLAGRLGLEPAFVDRIFIASPMHDIGKIGVPDHILLKPTGLTPAEWEIMKGHAAMGARILGDSRSPLLMMGAEIALNHHERWDGGGYPAGRRGEAIPLAARVMTICDVYDALRSKRPYKPALGHDRAVEIIVQGDGRTRPEHFDPAVLSAFQAHHREFDAVFQTHTATPGPDLRLPMPARPVEAAAP
jgi:putative two-component system response regulator